MRPIFLNHCQPLASLQLQLYEVASDTYDFNFYALLPEQKTLLILKLSAENPAVKDLNYNMFVLYKRFLEC